MDSSLDEAFLESRMIRLATANEAFSYRYPGLEDNWQPVHTLYGGAHLYKPGAAKKLGQLAEKHFTTYIRTPQDLLRAIGKDTDPKAAEIAEVMFDRIHRQLRGQPIEDHRADFEDGYGARADTEEDEHARAAALAMAAGQLDGSLPSGVGLRIKALTEEAKHRSLRTLDIFIATLGEASSTLPNNFVVTLPKVISTVQVEVLAEVLAALEKRYGFNEGSIRIELMLENVQSLFDDTGKLQLRKFVAAGAGRVSGFVLGTFDYTASCNVASTFQAHTHPAADFARQLMIANLMDSGIRIIDGITNIMPIGPHRGPELSAVQLSENERVVFDAWEMHFDNILHSMRLGIYQGWDLNPAQVPVRYAAVYYFYLVGLAESQKRLKTFVDQAAQASMVGNTFDDAATGQGLVNFFLGGLRCGALTPEELAPTGLSLEELEGRSFLQIVNTRVNQL